MLECVFCLGRRGRTMNFTIEKMISEEVIADRVAELGKELTAHYKDSKDLVLVGLLRGSYIFMADLSRKINVEHTNDFLTASSYHGGTESNRDVKILKDLDDDIKGKDVLLVEDIVDTGNTLSKVCDILQLREPKSIKICSLLDKPSRREIEIYPDWVGFEIPDEFVIGVGLDYGQKFRNLPYIGKVVFDK